MDIDLEAKKTLAKQRRRINKQAKEATARVDEHADRLAAEFDARWYQQPVRVADLTNR